MPRNYPIAGEMWGSLNKYAVGTAGNGVYLTWGLLRWLGVLPCREAAHQNSMTGEEPVAIAVESA